MSSVVVRPYEERDAAGFHTVQGLTYRNGDTSIPETTNWPMIERYVAELEGQIVGAFVALPMTASRGPATLNCGGIAAVAVAPDCRRGGVGSAMMRWYVSHARQTGVQLASLYAFRETYYRRFGYEVTGKRTRIVVPTERLPKVEPELPIRRLDWTEYPQLLPCYEAFAHQRSGLNLRQAEWQWKRVLAENKPLTIYAFGDPVEAYVAVSHHINFWEQQSISEFVWSSRRGYLAALAFLRQLGINKTSLAWFEPSDSPYYAQFLDQGIEAKIERPVMFRVADVPCALAALKPEGEGSFGFQLDDPVEAANDGIWQVRWSDGVVQVEKGGEPDFRLSIQAFAQAFMGEPSLAELANHEIVSVLRPEGFRTAQGLLTASATVCMDFF